MKLPKTIFRYNRWQTTWLVILSHYKKIGKLQNVEKLYTKYMEAVGFSLTAFLYRDILISGV